METLKAIVERTGTGYSAYIELDDGLVTTTGGTLAELKKNVREAYALFTEDTDLDPKAQIELSLDVARVFEYFPVINMTAFAKMAKINRSLLSQYVNGIKKPSEYATYNIINAIQKMGEELASVK